MRSRHFVWIQIIGGCLAVNFFAAAQTAGAGGTNSSADGSAATTSVQASSTTGQTGDANAKPPVPTSQATAPDLNPKKLSFGDVALGNTSDPQSVTITNNSGAKTKLKVGTPDLSDFVIDKNGCTDEVDAGKTCVVSMRFKPQASAERAGALQVSYEGDDKRPGSALVLEGSGYRPLGGICDFTHGWEILLILVVAVTYWLFMVVVRWHRIANSTRELLRGQIGSLRAELDLLPDLPPEPDAPQPPSNWRGIIAGVIEAAGLEVSPKIARKGYIHRLCNFLFWSRGQEIVGWGYVHDAEIKMAAHQPMATVVARLESASPQLKATGDAPCQALGQAIDAALAPDKNTSPELLRALLAQALQALNDREDNGFASLVSWQNKASWLVGCGLFVIIVLTIAIPHHAILFVVGAAGGLVSRLSRSLNRKDVPTDYGASWTTLFLSPVSGALGAWAGILVANLAVKLNVLNSVFETEFTNVCDPKTLAIAFIFGFSERLLDTVLDKIEEGATSAAKGSSPKPPAPTAPAAPGGGLIIPTTNLPNGKVGQAYQQNLQVQGAVGQVTWSVDATKLPAGLTLTDPASGAIGGTPTQANSFTFTATVKDGKSSQTQQVTIVINP